MAYEADEEWGHMAADGFAGVESPPDAYRTRRGTPQFGAEESIQGAGHNIWQNVTNVTCEPEAPEISPAFGGRFYGDTDDEIPATGHPRR